MNPIELAALEEDLKRDLEAISRVRKMMEAKNGQAKAAPQPPLPALAVDKEETDDDVDEAPVTSIRGTIERIINSSPEKRWTTHKMLAHLQQIQFPLKAKKPVYTVGQSLQILAERGSIRLIRRGAGSSPNVYKGKSSEPQREQVGLPLLGEQGGNENLTH